MVQLWYVVLILELQLCMGKLKTVRNLDILAPRLILQFRWVNKMRVFEDVMEYCMHDSICDW
jgi:hypothetical protein